MTGHLAPTLMPMRCRSVLLGSLLVAAMTLGACSSATHPSISDVYGDPTSTELTLSIGSCNQNPTVDVDETATKIRLTVTADADNSEDCADGATVTLDAPVGDRDIIDENTGEELELLPANGS